MEMCMWDGEGECISSHRAMMSQTQEIFVQKQTRVKENRLDKAAIRFNTSLAGNSKLRYMIDHLRKERAVFEGQYKQLQRVNLKCCIYLCV